MENKSKIERQKLMRSGAEDLEQWIFDLIRQGLAVLDGESTLWNDISARMVDAKMGGIAHKLRYLEQVKTDDWPEEILEEFGRLYLLTQGFKNFDKIPESLQTQLQLVGGLTVRKKDLIEEDGVLDEWMVLGNWQGVNVDQAAYRKIWMQGKDTQLMALLVEYDYRGGGFEGVFKVGEPVKAEMVYYPGVDALRVAIKHRYPPENYSKQVVTYENIEAMLVAYAEALSQNPWLSVFPCALEDVIPLYHESKFFLIDKNKNKIDLETKDEAGWSLLSMSGGKPVVVFGEWKGDRLFPLSVFAEGQFVDLGKYNSVQAPKFSFSFSFSFLILPLCSLRFANQANELYVLLQSSRSRAINLLFLCIP